MRKPPIEKSLAATNLDLKMEWHPTLNGILTPYDFTAGSGRKVWWKCKKDHSWDAVIASRSVGDRGCRFCTAQSSRGEIRLLAELQQFFDGVVSRKKIAGAEADIVIGELNLIIEYDGSYFHADKNQKDLNKNIVFICKYPLFLFWCCHTYKKDVRFKIINFF